MRARRLLLAGSAAAALSGERWTRRTRPTAAERAMTLPGDELVALPAWSATRAITIAAPRGEVWPWLVQMGYPTRRAGWYTPSWMDRVLFGIRARSAERIVPELQALAVGDTVPDSDTGVSFFTVAHLEPEHALVLRSHTHPLPVYRDVDFSWAFVLHHAGRSTRLLMRSRVTYTPVGPAAPVHALITIAFTLGDIVQAGAMLGGIRRRVEHGGAR